MLFEVTLRLRSLVQIVLLEHCRLALSLAGAAEGPARAAFKKSPGTPAHIIINDRDPKLYVRLSLAASA